MRVIFIFRMVSKDQRDLIFVRDTDGRISVGIEFDAPISRLAEFK